MVLSRSFILIGLSFVSIFLTKVFAAGGDNIRSRAPLTALVFDARDGNERPLIQAYFDDEIDFFLDIEPPRTPITRDLFILREAGRLLNLGDISGADLRIKSLRRFENERKYLNGVLLAAQGQHQNSLEQFRQLIDSRQSLSRSLSTMAFLGAARVFHEIGDFPQALYHYTQVRQLEPLFFQSVFEKSWSFYMSGDMNGALGATLSFTSPYFDNAFYPEAFIVRAAAFYQLCYFERATLTIEHFKRDYEQLRKQSEQLIIRGPESWLFDQRLIKSVNPKLLGFMMADRDFRGLLRAYLGLQNEVRRLRGQEAALSQEALRFVKNRLAQEARRVLERAGKILRDTLARADIIQIEILQTGANVLMGQKPEHEMDIKTIDLGNVDFDERVQFWPFKGEFWLDELGSHYYGLKSNCSAPS